MLFGLIRNDIGWEYNLAMLLAFALAILIALILHEVAHAFTALKMGDPSAKLAGRLSLNPAKHIEPLGLLCFCLAGIGWAKPVPVNPFNYRNFRKGNFWVSISGILTNFFLGLVFSLFYYIMYKYADITNIGLFGFYYFFFFATVVNISLMIFNLLPVFPLDGYNVLVSFTKPNNKFMQFMRENSMMVLIAVLIISSFTHGIEYMRDGIIHGFEWLWGLLF